MDRLTSRTVETVTINCGKKDCYECGEGKYELCSAQERVYDRLADYEDIGFTPSELLEKLDKLKRFEADEKAGLLVRLPCKVGDTVYEIDPPCPANGVIVGQVNSIDYFNGAMFRYKGNPIVKATSVQIEVIGGNGVGSTYTFSPEDFDKTVFLTREAAEAALKGGAI